MNNKTIILTGDRPTGPLHLGHFVGSLRQRVALQREYQQFVLVADLQGLTDNGSNPQKIRNNIPEVLADYLAAGIDPSLTTICLQSALPALAELTALYMNIVTVARVERNPRVCPLSAGWFPGLPDQPGSRYYGLQSQRCSRRRRSITDARAD